MKYIGKSTPCQIIQNKYKEKIASSNNFCQGNPNKENILRRYPKISFSQARRFSKSKEKVIQEKKTNKKYKRHKFYSERNKQKGMKFQLSQRIDYTKRFKGLPGPACYDKKNDLFKTAPSVSFQYKHDHQSFMYKTDDFIGPCNYKPQFNFWKKGIKFDREKKDINKIQKQSKENYQNEQFNNLKKPHRNQTFSKSIKKVNQSIQKSNNPGPGQYQIIQQKKVVQNQNFSTKKENQKKNQKIQILETPGPAQYHLQNEYSNFYKKGIKIYQQKRFKSLQFDCKNELDLQLLKDQKTQYNKGIIIFKQKYPKYENNNIPGPGQYNLSSVKRQSFTFNRQNKVKYQNKDQNITGPGSYDAKIQTRRQSQGIVFSRAKQKGEIQIDKRQFANLRRKLGQNKLTFGKQKRFLDKEKNDVGPASYNIRSTVPNNQPWLTREENKLIIT